MKTMMKSTLYGMCAMVALQTSVSAGPLRDLVGTLTNAAMETATSVTTTAASALYNGLPPVIAPSAVAEILVRHAAPSALVGQVAQAATAMAACDSQAYGVALASHAVLLTKCLDQAWANNSAVLQLVAKKACESPSLHNGLLALKAALNMAGVVCLSQLTYAGVVPAALAAVSGQ